MTLPQAAGTEASPIVVESDPQVPPLNRAAGLADSPPPRKEEDRVDDIGYQPRPPFGHAPRDSLKLMAPDPDDPTRVIGEISGTRHWYFD